MTPSLDLSRFSPSEQGYGEGPVKGVWLVVTRERLLCTVEVPLPV